MAFDVNNFVINRFLRGTMFDTNNGKIASEGVFYGAAQTCPHHILFHYHSISEIS